MRQANQVNRADLCHEHFSFLTRDNLELPQYKFTTNLNWMCLFPLSKINIVDYMCKKV